MQADLSLRWAHMQSCRKCFAPFIFSLHLGDSLSFHNGAVFSTKDRDVSLDKSQEYCAKLYKGAWWYNGCHESNLNGLYLNGSHPDTYYGQSVQWKTLKEYNYSLRKTEMKIRRI